MWSALPHMPTIKVVLEDSLLQATDRAVRRLKVNRSALIRDALREHLRRLRIREQEQRDREGYAQHPIARAEFGVWDRVAAWPDD
jgi:metal-responsive CopG/Arc/MetJ family transcriptional regulator